MDGRLFFAGEATSPGFFSTAHGAHETGLRAAAEVTRSLKVDPDRDGPEGQRPRWSRLSRYRKLSVRPRHPRADEEAQETFKKNFAATVTAQIRNSFIRSNGRRFRHAQAITNIAEFKSAYTQAYFSVHTARAG